MGVILYEQGGGQVHAPSLDLSNYQIVRKGDFVLNNQQAWRGSVGVSPHEGIISPAYFVLKLDDCLDPVFANYLMRSRAMVDQYVVSSKGVGDIQRTIFWPFLRKVLVPIPDLSEQKQIVDYLAKATSKLDVTISNITREIGLLTEYRTRLISDVVTGKLDVREAAKNLPAEIITEPSDDLIDGDEEEIEEAA
jgi:type I restriction enzyme S subunit